MSGDTEKLLRLIRAARAREPLSNDLASWVVELATSSIPALERELARNRLLRRAAALVIGSRRSQVLQIRTELLQTRRLWSYYARNPPESGSITAIVLEALAIDPDTPASESQIRRILGESEERSRDAQGLAKTATR